MIATIVVCVISFVLINVICAMVVWTGAPSLEMIVVVVNVFMCSCLKPDFEPSDKLDFY